MNKYKMKSYIFVKKEDMNEYRLNANTFYCGNPNILCHYYKGYLDYDGDIIPGELKEVRLIEIKEDSNYIKSVYNDKNLDEIEKCFINPSYKCLFNDFKDINIRIVCMLLPVLDIVITYKLHSENLVNFCEKLKCKLEGDFNIKLYNASIEDEENDA